MGNLPVLLILSDTETGRLGLSLLLMDNGLPNRVLTQVPGDGDQVPEDALVLVNAANEQYGLATCSSVRARMPNARIALIGPVHEQVNARRAFAAGADGFISADVTPDALVRYLQLIALGEKVMPSQLVAWFATSTDPEPVDMSGHMLEQKRLSVREAEVLRHLMAGEANKVIALSLGISEATVKIHVKSLLRKLHVQNRTQAAIWADQNLFIRPPVASLLSLGRAPAGVQPYGRREGGGFVEGSGHSSSPTPYIENC